MKYTNELNLPQPIVDAIANDEYERGQCNFTVSQLIDSPLIMALRQRWESELVEDASDNVWALIGSAIHTILEKADSTAITEKRLYANWTHPTLGVFSIGGAFDRLAMVEKILQDYKMASVWEVILGIKETRAQQLNLYRWLARENGYEVEGLQNIFLLRDWKVSELDRKEGYPPKQVHVTDVPVWTDEELERFLNKQIERHMSRAPYCTNDEIWLQPGKYAVMKRGRKTALRLLDTEDEALAWAKDNTSGEVGDGTYYLDQRLSKANRCKLNNNHRSYCPVSAFCDQWENTRTRWGVDPYNNPLESTDD